MAKRPTKTTGPFLIRMVEHDRVGPTKLVKGKIYTVSAEVKKSLGNKAVLADG